MCVRDIEEKILQIEERTKYYKSDNLISKKERATTQQNNHVEFFKGQLKTCLIMKHKTPTPNLAARGVKPGTKS